MGHTLNPYINKVIEENLVAAFPGVKGKENIFRVVHDLHVFKAVEDSNCGGWGTHRKDRIAIVNLIIPAGALVHINKAAYFGSKCRASEAMVHSIFTLNEEELAAGYSNWNPSFKYTKGATVTPTRRQFYEGNGVCKPGIHFFFSLEAAKRYL